MLEAMADGIIAFDQSGRVVASNSRVVRQFGLQPEHLATRDSVIAEIAGQLVEPARFLDAMVTMDTAPADGFTVATLDGRALQFFVGRQQVAGAFAGSVLVCRDVTAHQAALATLCHELRTPLSTIVGWAQILKAQPHDSGKAARAAELIQKNAQALVQLINDALDRSVNRRGKTAPD